MTPPARVSFTCPAWAALAVLGLLLLALLATQIVLLEDQRTTVDRQLAVAVRQAKAIEPAAADLRPFVREARPLVRDARAALPASRRLTEDATELVRDLTDARAPEQLEAAGALARALLRADVGQTTRDLARDLRGITDQLRDIGIETRDLTRTAARAAESLDRKTGPSLTPAQGG